MKTTLFLIVSLALMVVGCSSVPGVASGYDPNAKVTLGRVVARSNTGTMTSLRGETTLVPVGALFIPIALDRGTSPMPLYEYRVQLEDGRTVSIFDWDANMPVGGCVRLFESPRPDYPRLINSYGCKG